MQSMKPSSKKKNDKANPYPSHRKELNRLNRIVGQLGGVGKMIEEGRYCPDILVQTQAIRSAVKALEVSILDQHIRHCVYQACSSKNKREAENKIQELLTIYSRRN
jgi:DNA-binding FrmR family transcriptional regulator